MRNIHVEEEMRTYWNPCINNKPLICLASGNTFKAAEKIDFGEIAWGI